MPQHSPLPLLQLHSTVGPRSHSRSRRLVLALCLISSLLSAHATVAAAAAGGGSGEGWFGPPGNAKAPSDAHIKYKYKGPASSFQSVNQPSTADQRPRSAGSPDSRTAVKGAAQPADTPSLEDLVELFRHTLDSAWLYVSNFANSYLPEAASQCLQGVRSAGGHIFLALSSGRFPDWGHIMTSVSETASATNSCGKALLWLAKVSAVATSPVAAVRAAHSAYSALTGFLGSMDTSSAVDDGDTGQTEQEATGYNRKSPGRASDF